MTDLEALRDTILLETDPYGSKKRFGLFSHPITTAIGDNGQYKKKIHPRNQMGKPVTLPRNFYTSPTKSGQLASSYLGPLNPLATSDKKDTFIEEGKRLIKEQYQTFSQGRKQTNFYPIAGIKPMYFCIKIKTNSAYPFVNQNNPELDPKRFRNQDGRVKSTPRNALTNPQSKVIDSYFKSYKHQNDPYNRAHELELQRKKKEKSMEHESAFRPNSFAPKTFGKIKEVFGGDEDIKKSESKEVKLNIFPHENPWKSSNPNRHGVYGYLQPFPKYIESPPKQVTRKSSQKQKQAFKRMSIPLSKPSPSVTLNRVNIMRSVSHSFTSR